MSPAKIHPEETIWTTEYLLLHCQGYRVESAEGRLGYVEEVVQDQEWASGASRCRSGLTDAGILAIPIEGRARPAPEQQAPRRADAARTKR